MKKFLASIILAALILAGALVLQRYRVSRNFQAFSQGKTFHVLGLTLTLPPVSGGLRGFFNPYIKIDGATLSLDYDGQAMKWLLGSGRLTAGFWSPDSLRFVVPRWSPAGEEAVFEDLSFHLEPEGGMRKVLARNFFSRHPHSQEVLTLVQPFLSLGKWEGFLPDHLELGWKALEGEKEGVSGKFRLGEVGMGIQSNAQGARRLWEIFFRGKGGKTSWEGNTLDLKPWKLSFRGDALDMNRARAAALMEGFVGPLLGTSPGRLTEAPPRDEWLKNVFEAYDDLLDFIIQLDLKPEAGRYEWGGLKWESPDKRQLVTLGASGGKAGFRFQAEAFSGSSELLFDGATVEWPDHRVQLDGIKLFYSGDFKISYLQLLRNWIEYYRGMTQRLVQAEGRPDFSQIAGLFAQYPDQARYEIKTDRIYYKVPKTEGDYRNWTFGFRIDNLGPTFFGKGEVQQKFPLDPSKDISGSLLDISWGLRLPWEKWLKLCRRAAREPRSDMDWGKELMGELGGMETHWDWELGPNWFGGKLDWRVLADLGKAVEWWKKNHDTTTPPLSERMFQKYFAGPFLQAGTFDFAFLIRRFSKVQAMLEKQEPGATLGLAVVLPFLELDPQKDTLAGRLELKEGHLLVNGKRNEWIEGWLKSLP